MFAFVDSYRRLQDPLEKEKLRWLVWGVAISMLPALTLFCLVNVLNVWVPNVDLWINVALFFLPLSFGYAILSHRLMDIEIVLNRGLVYSAITLVLLVIFVAVENVLAALSLELTGRSSFALAMGAAVVMATLIEPVKRRVQLFVDRLFFAYKVQLRKGLEDLAEGSRSSPTWSGWRSGCCGAWPTWRTSRGQRSSCARRVARGPLSLRGDLIGFLLLSRRRNRELFNRDEIDLLNRLAIQAASDLTNARLQSRSRRLEEEVVALREDLLGGLRGLLRDVSARSVPSAAERTALTGE